MTFPSLPRFSAPLALLTLTACGVGEAAAPEAPASTPDVSVVTLRGEPLAVTDELPARVAALRMAEVRPQVGGIVRQRRFTEGDAVREGQPLYEIDKAAFRAEVASASAALQRSRAALAQAQINADRAGKLFERGATTQQAVDDTRASLALAKAEVAQARAALERRRLDLRYATITAPIAGQVGISRISEGALVAPSDPTPLTVIQQIDQVYVDIKQPAERADALHEALAPRAEGEGAIEITVLSSSGEPYPERGRVLFSDISVDPGTGEITVRALVPNASRRLLPGMFVRARVERGEIPDAILVPQQAVQRDPTGGAQVLVVGADGKVEVRAVTTGRVVEGRYVITRGLAPGDRVAIEGHDRLAPGAVVNPVEWQPPLESAQR
jgi:membrane fusion protein (multidrug efflux system)/multidrug efflux system membrane fusion protein